MKKWIALAVVVVIFLAAYNRNRIFVRDLLGSVMRSGAKEPGAQVYINFSNDVLIENDNPPMYMLVVQHNNHFGSPVELHCLHWVLCLTDADTTTVLTPPPALTIDQMTSKSVRLTDNDKRETLIKLR